MAFPPLYRRTRRSRTSWLNRRLWLILLFASPLLFLASLHASGSVLRRSNSLGRRCIPESLAKHPPPPPRRIAIVSFSDEAEDKEDTWRWGKRRRSFQGLMETVGGNKKAYADSMGYDFIDARDLVDPGRPPNWSKILAVRSHLPNYDWVFWNDADTVVTNPNISLEGILQAVIGHSDFNTSPDFVATEDINGVNSGVFFVRRSKWSENFLDTWWNQTSFIRFGSTKSGDNGALKHLIDSLSPEEFRDHVRISSMQCLFNSYPWFPTSTSAHRLIFSPRITWSGAYSQGDFMVHLAGLDEKQKWAAKILGEIKAEK